LIAIKFIVIYYYSYTLTFGVSPPKMFSIPEVEFRNYLAEGSIAFSRKYG
jgi:hypothetical protein